MEDVSSTGLAKGEVEEKVLAYLLENDKASYYAIARDLRLPESTVYRQLKALEKRGLVRKACRGYFITPRGIARLYFSTSDEALRRRCVRALVKAWGVEADEREASSFLSWLSSLSLRLKIDPSSLPFCDILGLALFAYSKQEELDEMSKAFVVKVLTNRLPSTVTSRGCNVVAFKAGKGHFIMAGYCRLRGYAFNFFCDELSAIILAFLFSTLLSIALLY